MRVALAIFSALLLPLYAAAFNPKGLEFSHFDWELACDNTGTCRAAGYQSDDFSDHAVSVLLTRAAGAGQAVSAIVKLGEADANPVIGTLPPAFKLSLRINGQLHGTLEFKKESLKAELSPNQIDTLLTALAKNADIELSTGTQRWQLSDRGAAAVLLKMDEYQGRIGSAGALLRKGKAPESSVPPAVPAPLFTPAAISKPQPGDAQFASRHQDALIAALRTATKKDDCDDLFDDIDSSKITVVRLSSSKMLVSIQCWVAAYNSGNGYWVVNERPPFQPQLVTASGNDSDGATVSESHKGRGLGDCWSFMTWSWNGKSFEVTSKSTSGMCKSIEQGGAWSLPTIVTSTR